MLVNISSFRSESATKKQQENFNTAFGFKPADGTRILKTLEALSKEKVVNTQHLDTILGFLKSADADTVAAYARKAVAKANAVVFKALDKAKTLTVVVNNLKKIKSTGIVVSDKPVSGSGSNAGLFSMIVPVTQDDATSISFPPKSWYAKTGAQVVAFEPGEIDYEYAYAGGDLRNFLFSGTKQQLEAFKLVMAEDDPYEDFGPYKITKFKMPRGYIPAGQAKEYARKNGVKIKGLVGSDRKPTESKPVSSTKNIFSGFRVKKQPKSKRDLQLLTMELLDSQKTGSFKWSDIVETFTSNNVNVKDWMEVRAVLQQIYEKDGVIKRDPDLRQEIYYYSDGSVNESVTDIIKILRTFESGYDDAEDAGNPGTKRVDKMLRALGVNITPALRRTRLLEIDASNSSSGRNCLSFHVSTDGGETIDYIVNYDLKSGSVFAEKDLDNGKLYYQGGSRRVIRGTEVKVKTAAEFGKAVTGLINNKRLVSMSNDPDVNTKVLEVVKLLKNLGGYGEAVDEGNPAVSAINKKLKSMGVNVDSPRLKGRLVEIAYRLDSRAKCLAFHVSSDGGDSVSHIVNYDLNTGTVFAEKDLDDGKMFHQGGPRRVIPGSESAVRTVSEFGAAVSAKIGSKLFS